MCEINEFDNKICEYLSCFSLGVGLKGVRKFTYEPKGGPAEIDDQKKKKSSDPPECRALG